MTRHIRVLIIGAALILAGNAAALIGVAYNRSGKPAAVLEFSDRELIAPFSVIGSKENSGLTLHLLWRNENFPQLSMPGSINHDGSTPWFDKAKLAEVGFDVSADPKDPAAARRYQKTLPRKAYVVLEFNGPAYQAVVQKSQEAYDKVNAKLAAEPDNQDYKKQAKFAQEQLDHERNSNSRLFAVDVGPDPDQLLSRYPDRAHYFVLPGEVRLTSYNQTLSGYITNLSIETVNVPLAHRTAIVQEGGARRDHYTVRLAFGKRAEPWILDAQPVL